MVTFLLYVERNFLNKGGALAVRFDVLQHSAALQATCAQQRLGALNAGCVLAHRWCEGDLYPPKLIICEFYDLRLTQPPFARTPLIFLICS